MGNRHPRDDQYPDHSARGFLLPSLTVLGVVYGDIGTSPLYALRECFHGGHSLPPTPANVLGVLSLIFWALTLVISVKYLTFMMRADNRGEGGILALLSLLMPANRLSSRQRRLLLPLGLFGAAFLYGDGAITPAISVLSAVEGLKIAAPELEGSVQPLTLAILVALFLFQKRGTAKVGLVFGPTMAVWFITLAVLGVGGILQAPQVLGALSPHHAFQFFLANGRLAFFVLGAVFLVVTGGEALYADMGHFGPRPIRLAWFVLVFPALLLNYLGQGALLLLRPAETREPFFHLAPDWALYPLVLLATVATVIASQAVISGAFSLTRQAIQLGYSPRLRLVQTSSEEIGQVYCPAVNNGLMLTTLALVIGFGSSTSLAGAYGVAVTTTMVITTVLAFFLMIRHWRWHPAIAGAMAALFLAIDLPFFGANLLKIGHGGWFPIIAGGAVFVVMTTWHRGRTELVATLQGADESLSAFIEALAADPPHRVPGTAVFMTGRTKGTPPILHHHLAHNQVLHEQVVVLTVITEELPRVPAAERVEVTLLPLGFARVLVRYGFMQSPHVPVALRQCEPHGLTIDLEDITYYLARERIIAPRRSPALLVWREKLFAFLNRNALGATVFFNLPPEQVVELGQQVEI
ncbi:MAG: potassium transporter Kup [Desulfuromonadales bacterium]|nr:potassium transporter Kup [Desulfuromonadales bacterium]